jgi:transcriptional regulator with XRE-family HTH domain
VGSGQMISPQLKQMTVPQRIRWLRKQAGSHDKLAAKVGTSRQVIIRWEKGTSKPRAESRRRLASASGLPASLFRDGTNSSDDEEEDPVIALLSALSPRAAEALRFGIAEMERKGSK